MPAILEEGSHELGKEVPPQEVPLAATVRVQSVALKNGRGFRGLGVWVFRVLRFRVYGFQGVGFPEYKV